MPTNDNFVEFVKFEAAGLEDIIKNVGELEEFVKKAATRYVELNNIVSSPAVRAAAEGIARMKSASDALAASEAKRTENAVRRGRLESGSYLRDRAASGQLNRETNRLGYQERQAALASGLLAKEAILEGRLRADIASLARAERRTMLSSGAFAEGVHYRELGKHEDAQIERAERRAELRVTHGRLGGAAAFALERMRPGLLAAGAVGGAGLAAGRAGLAGTVQGERLAFEIHLLNREIAGALLPVVRDLTNVIRFFRTKLEGLSGTQQSMLGYGIAGAAGLGAIGLATSGISKAIGGLSKIMGAVGLRATAAAGGSLAGIMAANAAGTAAGNIAGNAVAGAGAAGGAAASRFGRVARFARFAGPVAVAAAVAKDALHEEKPGDESYYRLLRQRGNSKGISGLYSTLYSATEMFGLYDLFGTDRKADLRRQKTRDNYGGEDAHRNPLIAQAGFESFDDAYRRVAENVALRSAMEAEPGGALEPKNKIEGKPGEQGVGQPPTKTDSWLERIFAILEEGFRLTPKPLK